MWPFLLDVFPWTSSTKERVAITKGKTCVCSRSHETEVQLMSEMQDRVRAAQDDLVQEPCGHFVRRLRRRVSSYRFVSDLLLTSGDQD